MRTNARFAFLIALAALAVGPSLRAAPAPASLPDAAMQGDPAAVAALLKSGADVNTAQGDGMTALHWTALKNDVNVARLLLKAGASVGATTRLGAYTPLLLAPKTGHAATITEPIEAGANPNAATTHGTTALMLAAASGKTDAVNVLLARGGNVNAMEVKGQTALMFAAVNGRTDVVRLLTAKGADVKLTTHVIDLTI